jgi:hypothetical protein
MLKILRFPEEIGQCHGTPLIFFDTNAIIDSPELVRYIFNARGEADNGILGVICDFIEGEARNLKQGVEILDELKNPNSAELSGIFFKSHYNARDESKRSLEDMPTPEMKEAVLDEFDKVFPKASSPKAKTTTKKAGSNYVDFALLTVATISSYKRKKQSIVVTRDRWVKSACESLRSKFSLPISSQDQFNFSMEPIVNLELSLVGKKTMKSKKKAKERLSLS